MRQSGANSDIEGKFFFMTFNGMNIKYVYITYKLLFRLRV